MSKKVAVVNWKLIAGLMVSLGVVGGVSE